jgi:hypothetical protein
MRGARRPEWNMRAEAQIQVDEIQQALSLLRRHL